MSTPPSHETPHPLPVPPPAPPAAGSPYPPAAPGYAYPPAAPAYAAPATPPTNSLAIVSFVAALIGFLVVPLLASVAAIITGHISLKQIATRGEGGRGLALAGTIIGWVGAGIWIVAVVFLIFWFVVVFSVGAAGGYYA